LSGKDWLLILAFGAWLAAIIASAGLMHGRSPASPPQQSSAQENEGFTK
jgi:hypothetical protein